MKNSLKFYREKCGATQQQIADKLEIAVSTYNMLENGKRNVSLFKAKQLSIILNASIEELFFKK